MKLKKLWKDSESNIGHCPALYRTDGGYVVQGKALDEETRAQLSELGADENAVFVPGNVLDRLRDLT